MTIKKFTSLMIQQVDESIKIKQKFSSDRSLSQKLFLASNIILKTIRSNKKIMMAGNGGSAADAQHFTAELLTKFKKRNRKHLPAFTLTTDPSVITSIGNDYSFDEIYSKQIEALAFKGDLLICFSTSMKSKNILLAIKAAKKKNMNTIVFCGKQPKLFDCNIDLFLDVNSLSTARIQEAHLFFYHVICNFIDTKF